MTAENEGVAQYRLSLTTERWVDWYSETRVLTAAQAKEWIRETFAEPVGQYLKLAQRFDPERNEWMVF